MKILMQCRTFVAYELPELHIALCCCICFCITVGDKRLLKGHIAIMNFVLRLQSIVLTLK